MTGNKENERSVQCVKHGPREAAYVCRHLNLTDKVGFYQAYDPENPEEEVLNAWCDECERVRLEGGGEWNDKSEGFAQIWLVCSECFYRNAKTPSWKVNYV